MAVWFKYFIGNIGPQLFKSENGELPFRVQRVQAPRDAGFREEGIPTNIALDLNSGIAGLVGGNIAPTISAADYAAFRAAHFNSFNIGGDSL